MAGARWVAASPVAVVPALLVDARMLAWEVVMATVLVLCRLHIRTMPEPVYDLPRWYYSLRIVWLPKLTGQIRRR